MKRKKMNIIRRAGICGALAAALTAGLAGCGAKESAGTAGTEPASASDSRAAGGEETRIAAGADGFQIEGDGASVSGNTVTISRAGTYRLSGDMADGNLLVNAEENDEIRLVFDGFSIASADIAPIYVSQCGSVTVETAAGTENSVTDGRTYEKTEDDESPDAAIFSECDLILEGEGTLAVSGQFQEGIRGKDDVTVASGTIRIEALNDGLKGKDAVYIEGGTLEITAGDDGIQSDNEKDSDKGFVTVSGGTVTIDAVGKGIQGESRVDISGGKVAVVNSEEGIEALVIEISGGEVDIFAADDGINAAGSSGMAGEPGAAGGSGKAGNLDLAGEAGGGRHPFGGVTEGACITISGGTLTLVSAAGGVQADGDLTISGGTFDITANGGHETVLAEDADSCKGLKADGMLSVTGGTFAIDSADDAIHADNALTVGAEGNDAAVPAIVITDSTEGLEGTTVTVRSGDLDITASDDGVNAANSDIGERSDLFAIQISGGDLYICAGADGLDSNNDINMTGGTVEVYGADAGMDTAIDYDGTFTLSGGTLLGAGMTPSAGTQAYVAFGSTMSGGMGGGQPGGGMEGGAPPENADGTVPDGQDGEPMPDRGERPNMPDGEAGSAPEDMTPPDDADGERPTRPDGMGGGMQAENMLGISEGSTVAIEDADGNTLYETTAAGRMSGVIFSSAAVSEGESYTLLVDGETVQTAQAVLGSSNDPGMGGQPSDGSGFRDVQADAWYADAVQYVVSEGLMNGTDAATFSPDAPMSRAMLVTVLYRLSGEPALSQDSGFADVASDAYYADAVSWAVGEGIVTGTSQTTFSPDESVTREQMAVLLYRCAGEPSTAGDLSAHADAENISDYAAEAMSWCVENGILSGTDGGRLAPADSATRAETAAVLQRFAAL